MWLGATVAVMGLAGAAMYATRSAPGVGRHVIPGESDSTTVEVLNGAAVDGLARRTTLMLRSAGVDVVYFGTARDSVWQVTEVLARGGDTAAARRVADLLGYGVVRDEPDPDLLLDVTVYLGLDAVSDGARFDP